MLLSMVIFKAIPISFSNDLQNILIVKMVQEISKGSLGPV